MPTSATQSGRNLVFAIVVAALLRRLNQRFAAAFVLAICPIFFSATAMAGCNSGAAGNTDLLNSANCQAIATGTANTAVGFGATAAGSNSVAVGDGAFVNPIANGTAIGASSLAGSAGTTAVGASATAQGTNSTAVGYQAFSNANTNDTIMGAQAKIFAGANGTAIGEGAIIGLSSSAANNTAIGQGSVVDGLNSTGLGQGSRAIGDGSTALGQSATATAIGATALGQGTSATFVNSTAVGAGVATTRANQVAVGTAANTYTLAGVTSAASLAAQSGPVSLVTSDAAGNLAVVNTSNIASVTALSALDGRVTNLETNVRSLNADMRKAFEGSAVAIAMGGAALPDNKRFAISANWGNFSGENAFGGMAQLRLSNNFVANAAVGAGFARGGIGGRVGGTLAW
ncbi:hypothetical protein [Bradyrhizobium sp. Cp5.3]|uniref:hypothetical protein n=1 Tax=Bradyrhizobium sp. Cp5.3 TaxID=443598 RepID=UPI0012EC9F45|nr:hypothetical protein [Bradyrhizobium sp. Cp5.3]